MAMSRRRWLSITISGFGVSMRPVAALVTAQSVASDMPGRISRIIREYEEQGFHRTGTTVDQASADWLSGHVRQVGLMPTQEPFQISRVDPVTSVLIADDRRLEGLPLFDGAFTDSGGVRGRFGILASNAEIGFTEVVPNTAAAGALGEARRTNRHRAIVCVTRGGRPGLCPSNADSFLQPFGPPVLQLSSAEASWLNDQAQRGADVQLIAHAIRTPARSVNVTSMITGTEPSLPPLVVMTPRSGWYRCASERGGGIACWLEVMRALRPVRPRRSILFVASGGHELGHRGINAFVDRRPGIVAGAVAWMHFGANIGAATESGNRLQASADVLDDMLSREMSSSQLNVDLRVPRGRIPGGEAEVVHRGGGRYVSIIGLNALFHNPEDRGPHAIDSGVIARFCTAFTSLATKLSGT